MNDTSGSCVFVLNSLSVGGSERKIVMVANRLAKRGRKIHIAVLNEAAALRESIDPSIPILDLKRKGKFDSRVVRLLGDYIKAKKISLAWAVNLYPMLYAYLSTRSFSPHVRVVGSSNTSSFHSLYESLQMLVYVPVIRRLDSFVFGSYSQMDNWKKKYRLGGTNMLVIHNGVDLSAYKADDDPAVTRQERVRFGFREDEIVVGMVAQFRPEKAQSDLLMAVKKMLDKGRPIKVLLIGDGEAMDVVRTVAEQLGITEAVIFTGLLKDVKPALIAMDIFALTSRSVETFSNAALEAMAMSLPVVLSDIGGAREMVEHGVNGYLFPPGDVEKLYQRLELLTDESLRHKLGATSRDIVEKNFSSTAMVDQYENLIWPTT